MAPFFISIMLVLLPYTPRLTSTGLARIVMGILEVAAVFVVSVLAAVGCELASKWLIYSKPVYKDLTAIVQSKKAKSKQIDRSTTCCKDRCY